jgi:Flp pilus assembly protein TadB
MAIGKKSWARLLDSRRARSQRKGNDMTIDRAVLAFAGTLVLLSVALVYWVSAWWLLLTVLIGLNMLQSAFTGFCPAAMVFKKMSIPPGAAFGR